MESARPIESKRYHSSLSQNGSFRVLLFPVETKVRLRCTTVDRLATWKQQLRMELTFSAILMSTGSTSSSLVTKVICKRQNRAAVNDAGELIIPLGTYLSQSNHLRSSTARYAMGSCQNEEIRDYGATAREIPGFICFARRVTKSGHVREFPQSRISSA